jgi:hypothetical protein
MRTRRSDGGGGRRPAGSRRKGAERAAGWLFERSSAGSMMPFSGKLAASTPCRLSAIAEVVSTTPAESGDRSQDDHTEYTVTRSAPIEIGCRRFRHQWRRSRASPTSVARPNFSSGQRPGFELQKGIQALKGRVNESGNCAVWHWNALSGLSVAGLRYPWRCPGLKLNRRYGDESKIWVALRGGDIISSAAGRAKFR